MERHRILLVGNDPHSRALLEGALGSNYETLGIDGGAEALEILEDCQPDLAIVESTMHDMDGLELCREIHQRDRYSALPILFLAAANNKEDYRRGYAAGCNLIIAKPVDPKRLRKNIDFTVSHDVGKPSDKDHSLADLNRMKGRRQEARLREARLQDALQRRDAQKAMSEAGSKLEAIRQMRREGRAAEARRQEALHPAPSGGVETEPTLSAGHDEPEATGQSRHQTPPPADSGPLPRVTLALGDPIESRALEAGLNDQFEFTHVFDGLETVDALQKYEPDVLVLDLMIPKINGIQILKWTRRNATYHELPVIIVCEESREHDRAYMDRLGATDFLTRPFGRSDMLNCLEAIVRAPSFRVALKRATLLEIRQEEITGARLNGRLWEWALRRTFP